MRPLPPLLLVPLALLLLLPQARGSACPARCDCALDGSPLELVCRRAGGRGRVELQGERTKYLNVICKQDASNFTCEDVPEFDFGRNGTLEELSFSRCPLEGLSVACVAARVGAREVVSLTVEEPPGGPRLLPGHVRGLRGVRRVFLQGREERDEEVDVPWSAVELLPDLEQLAVTSVRARLGSGSGATSSGSGMASSGSGATSSGSGAVRLRRLEISMARLPAPPPGAFAGLPALTELSLFRNDIDNITQDMFQNLTSLEVLDLSSNQLSELDGNALAGCPQLRELLAYDNPLQQLRPLAPLPHLQKVEIFECSPASLEVQPGALSALPRLQHVILRACGVLALPPDALAGSVALLTLDLSENQLTSLPATLFADQKALQALDLSGNQLESLPRDLLWSLGALQRLNLDDNRLLELPDRFVEGLPLRDLSAAGNQMQHLTRATFAGAGALEQLDLSRNNLTQETDGQYWNLDMVASPFNALLKLQTLDLSYNALTALPQDIAPALLHLTSLNMSHNNITYITDLDNSLTFLSPNVTVDLRDNQISVVELSPALWRAAPTPGYASRVLLQGNPLRCDCRLYQLVRRVRGWSGAATLPTLVAADVTCAATPSVVGKPLANLTDADLACDIPATDCVQGCSCFRLPLTIALTCKERFDALPEHFDTFPLELKLQFPPESLSWLPPNVKTLDLSNLNITEVPDFNFTAIKSVDLRGNELTSVPVGMLDANATVWVSGNPLACDCWRAGAVRALQASAAAGRVPDWPAAACSGGGPARLVDPSRLCRHLALAVGSALLAVLGLLSAVAAVLLLRYSMHVKVFLYARGWCRCWVREDRDQGRFEYDAFVSFAHEDASLVMEQLLPGLEGGPRPFKVCVHYRDWIAGEWIPAQIAQSVERSRYTIVVVSKHFLDSKWGRLEFRAANMSAIREKRARVIVVLLEDVAGHPELDAELRAYFATNTYLKWNDPWFWDRLRYALRHKAEARMRRAGQRLAQLMGDQGDQCKKAGLIGGGDHPNGGKTGGLDTQLAPNGKILNAAIKAKEHKISGIV